MAAHKHIDAICIAITVFTLLLTILFMNGKALGITVMAGGDESAGMFTENDLDSSWNTSNATKIRLSDEGSTVSGNGAYVYQGDVHIVYAGKYVLTGELSDGSVIIEADGDDKIWLMLDGVSIHCEDGAAIRVEQADKVFLTLADGTENTLSSGSSYNEEAVSSGVDGTVYSRDDLTVNGAGSLTVTAEYRHGIVCNDDLVITGGALDVTAAQDAIHANDSVRICNANLTLSAGDDGITASNDDETSFIYVESGAITIPNCYEGLEAVEITIAGGTIDIDPTDDGINANGNSGSSLITITGGEITVTDENGRDADGIDSNGDILISGGRLFVSVSDNGGSCAIDYGSESGGKCVITGGTVLACGSSGMAESFDSSSTQGFLMLNTSAPAGTTVTVRDANGNELISETVPCSFSSILVSTPDLKIGDTCTLIVGDTQTQMTIDNASSGGFGGGRMPGGNGFGGGKMSGRGSFGREGGTPDSGSTDETPDSESTPNGSELSAADAMPVVSLLSAGDFGSVPDDLPNDDETSSDFPRSGRNNGTLPEFPEGGMPGFSQNEDNSNTPQSGITPGSGIFGGHQNGGTMRGPNWNTQGQDSGSQPSAAETQISAESLVLLAVSAIALLIGCAVAARYKRRG